MENRWEYFGDKETRKGLLRFFATRKETLIAGNKFCYFWGNDNGEWRFLSLSLNQELVGTIMEVADSGIFVGDKLIARFGVYYVKNPIRVQCSTLKKPAFRNFRKAMYGSGKGSYGKGWMLYPTGELAKLGDIVKLLKGSIKELPKEVKPPLQRFSDRDTLRKNGFYMPTLKGGLKIATKGDDLYILRGDSYEKSELSKNNIVDIKNEQFWGLLAVRKNLKERGWSVDCDFEYICRHRKDNAAKCLECGETIESGESYYCFDCKHYFTPIYSHIYHWQSKQQAKCKACGSPVKAERIHGI